MYTPLYDAPLPIIAAGYYVYIEASDHWQSLNDRALLVSRTVSHGFSGTKCLLFWYHMHGKDMGSLNVHLRNYTGGNTKYWGVVGDQGDEWNLGRLSFTHNGPFQVIVACLCAACNYYVYLQIIFEALIGPGIASDIALDDIELTDGYCYNDGNPCTRHAYWYDATSLNFQFPQPPLQRHPGFPLVPL